MKQTSLTWMVVKLLFWLTVLGVAFIAKCYYNYEIGKTISNILSQ